MDPLQFYFDGEMEIVRSDDSQTWCAAQRLKNGRVVIGDGTSCDEARSLCLSEALRVVGSGSLDLPKPRHAA